MNRIPLLQAMDGGALSPAGTPRSPAHSWRFAYNFFTFAATILVLGSLCFSTIHMYETDKIELFNRQHDPSLGWGQEGPIYQACRSSADPASLPDLLPVQQWHSQKSLPDQSVNIVTQLSLERLTMLRGQCRVWKDRIAAVVYVPMVDGFGVASAEVPALNGSSLVQVTRLLDEFYRQIESEAECALDLELVVETFPSWDDPALPLYPFNAIRNRGLLLARSEAVLLLDVDFLPAASLPGTYQGKPNTFAAMMAALVDNKTAFVLPAFETAKEEGDGRRVALTAALNGKPHAVSLYRKKEVAGFHMAQYKSGHGGTNFTRWLTTTKAYPVKYRRGFEPYVVVARRYVPWYDERFRGYGRDKITHLAHMCDGLGVSLQVHPTAFVVHSPHAKAPTYGATKASGQWDALEDMYAVACEEIEAGVFVPVTSFAQWCPRTVAPDEAAAPVLLGKSADAAAVTTKTKKKMAARSSRRALDKA